MMLTLEDIRRIANYPVPQDLSAQVLHELARLAEERLLLEQKCCGAYLMGSAKVEPYWAVYTESEDHHFNAPTLSEAIRKAAGVSDV